MVNREIFEKFICQNDKISYHELDKFFANLEPIELDEIIGEWQGGYFSTGVSKLEILLNDFIIFKWYGKNFLDQNNVKALVFSFLGIKFNIPCGAAVLHRLEFRDRISTSMIYNYLPIIDNFRKVDSDTVVGIMEIKGRVSLYFYLLKKR